MDCSFFMHFLTAQTPSERAFNAAQRRTRSIIERTFGVWKRRFPALHYGLRTKLETTLAIIPALAVLHNVAIKRNDPLPPLQDPLVPEHVPVRQVRDANNRGNDVRRRLVQQYF
jgi:hypothetical protein